MSIPGIIDAKRLAVFYQVAQAGSLSRAEGGLHLPQSAISRHIMRLEEDLGVQLLERHGRGVTLTSFGELLQGQAEVILREMSIALAQIDDAKRSPAARVRVSASAIVMSQFMPEIVDRLMSLYPEIEIIAVQAASGEVYDSLVSGKVDLAIVMYVPNKSRYRIVKVLEEPLVLIASRSHPIASMDAVNLKELTELSLVLPSTPHGLRSVIEDWAHTGGIDLTPHLQADSVPLIKGILARGKVCTILPQLTFEEDFGQEEYVGLPLQPALSRTLYAATRKGETKSLHLDALLKIVVEVFAEKSNAVNGNGK